MESSLTDLLILALVVEVVTNLAKNYIPTLKTKGATSLVAGVLGAVLCIVTSTGVLAATGIEISYLWLDHITTGVIIARIAGIINDLSQKLSK